MIEHLLYMAVLLGVLIVLILRAFKLPLLPALGLALLGFVVGRDLVDIALTMDQAENWFNGHPRISVWTIVIVTFMGLWGWVLKPLARRWGWLNDTTG